jgi:hypothetical protein
MSRQLPSHPNLEHLKKQAKNRLGELQKQNPEAKLADSLHATAREYGFATWPMLKAYVLSLPIQSDPVTQQNPFVGIWSANVSKSKRHPANQFQRATLEFVVDRDTVTITHAGIDASGQEEHSTNTIHADGKDREVGGSGYVLMARWLGSNVLETIAKKDGQVVGQGRYEVSADGQTLTVSSKDANQNAQGWQSEFEQVIVLDRR